MADEKFKGNDGINSETDNDSSQEETFTENNTEKANESEEVDDLPSASNGVSNAPSTPQAQGVIGTEKVNGTFSFASKADMEEFIIKIVDSRISKIETVNIPISIDPKKLSKDIDELKSFIKSMDFNKGKSNVFDAIENVLGKYLK